jgi:hypothetical protein
MLLVSIGHLEAAVDVDDLSVDVLPVARGEKAYQICHFGGISKAF